MTEKEQETPVETKDVLTEKIELTLGEESEKSEEIAEETTLPEAPKLSEAEQKMVDDFASKIDIQDATTVLQYGASAQNKVADFSENALKNVKTQDLNDIGEMMTDLVAQLKSFNTEQKDNFFERFFKRSANKVTALKARYEDANSNIEKIVKTLEGHQVTLLKDIALLDQLYAKNQIHFKEISMYILAGQKKLQEVKEKDLLELEKKAQASKLPEDAQAVNDLNNSINRFEKKLHDLELTRMVALQMPAQIRLVQNNDTLMAEKIQSTLVNTIPLWKSQMLIALGLQHSKEAIEAQNAVTEMTNTMLKNNAENLHIATSKTAQASERGIVDLETLAHTNKELIDTLQEVSRIQKEGREKRAAAQMELRKMEVELAKHLSDTQKELENKVKE